MSGQVASIDVYPLTGAQGISVDIGNVTPSGLAFDREFVVYDASKVGPSGEYSRLGQRQLRELAQVTAELSSDTLHLQHGISQASVEVPYQSNALKSVLVSEFGDNTHAQDTGDRAALFLAGVTNNPDVRLARKSNAWLDGEIVLPMNRRNAPLHIISQPSVDAVSNLLGAPVPANRFRANLLIDGFAAFAEADWVGRRLQIGQVVVEVTRLTERCPVPGNDQMTGENLKDVPRIYPALPRGVTSKKPTFGFYAVPLLGDKLMPQIALGDPVELIDDEVAPNSYEGVLVW